MKIKKDEFIHNTCVRRSKGRLVLYKLPQNAPKIVDEVVKTFKYSIDWLINYQGDDVVLKWGYRYAVLFFIGILVLLFAIGDTFREGTPFIQSLLQSFLGVVSIIALTLLLAFTIFMHLSIYWANYARLAVHYIKISGIDSTEDTIANLSFPSYFKWSSHTIAMLIAYTPLALLLSTSPFFRRLLCLLFIAVATGD